MQGKRTGVKSWRGWRGKSGPSTHYARSGLVHRSSLLPAFDQPLRLPNFWCNDSRNTTQLTTTSLDTTTDPYISLPCRSHDGRRRPRRRRLKCRPVLQSPQKQHPYQRQQQKPYLSQSQRLHSRYITIQYVQMGYNTRRPLRLLRAWCIIPQTQG
jgi:hypothetical protein